MKKFDDEIKTIIKDADKRLTGFKRRAYQARVKNYHPAFS